MRVRVMSSLALSATLLFGCSDEGSGDADYGASSSASPDSSEATESEESPQGVPVPVLPDSGESESSHGAEVFVRHYIKLLNYASATGHVAELVEASHACTGCRKYEDLFRTTYSRGGYMKSAGWTPSSIDVIRQRGGGFVALVTVHAARMRYKLTKESDEKIGRGDKYRLRFLATREGDRWVMRDFSQQADTRNL